MNLRTILIVLGIIALALIIVILWVNHVDVGVR